MSTKIVLYARGGGIGHFNRAYAIARQLLRSQQESLIVCSSAFLPTVLSESLNILRWPGGLEQAQVLPFRSFSRLLAEIQPRTLLSDTFPYGPEDELKHWCKEHAEQHVWIQRDPENSDVPGAVRPYPDGVGWVLNRNPEELLPRALARQWLRAEDDKALVLVTHNGHAGEVSAFFERMLQMLKVFDVHVRLASLLPCPRPEWLPFWVHAYPLSLYFHGVDLVIGGGGYNLVAEVRALGKRALLRAFERPVDNQAQRIAALPHFSFHTSLDDLRQQCSALLASPEPLAAAPEECRGASRIAQLLLERL